MRRNKLRFRLPEFTGGKIPTSTATSAAIADVSTAAVADVTSDEQVNFGMKIENR